MNTKTVKLATPLQTKAGEVTSLTFRKAKVGDLIAGDAIAKNSGSDIARAVAILASMAGITYAEFRDLDVDDLVTIQTETAELLGNFTPAIGEAPPA